MKKIYSIGKGKYIHIDSYSESHETRRIDVVLLAIATIIMSLTIGAMLGIDITLPNSIQQHETTRRINR